jgi:hypothetical protein
MSLNTNCNNVSAEDASFSHNAKTLKQFRGNVSLLLIMSTPTPVFKAQNLA